MFNFFQLNLRGQFFFNSKLCDHNQIRKPEHLVDKEGDRMDFQLLREHLWLTKGYNIFAVEFLEIVGGFHLWSAFEKEVFHCSFDREFGSIFCIFDVDGLCIHLGSSIISF